MPRGQHGAGDSQLSSSFMSVSAAEAGSGSPGTTTPPQTAPAALPMAVAAPAATSFSALSHHGASVPLSIPIPRRPSGSSLSLEPHTTISGSADSQSSTHFPAAAATSAGGSGFLPESSFFLRQEPLVSSSNAVLLATTPPNSASTPPHHQQSSPPLPIYQRTGLSPSPSLSGIQGGTSAGASGGSTGKEVSDRIRVVARLKPQLKRVPKAYLPYSIQNTDKSASPAFPHAMPSTTLNPSEEVGLPFLSLFTEAENHSSPNSIAAVASAAASAAPKVMLSIVPPGVKSGSTAAMTSSSTFALDQVLDASDTDEKMCGDLVHPLLHRVRQGRHSTVLLHGPSGSGKTHTLNIAASGLAQGLFTSVLNSSTDILEMSYLQIQDNRAYHLIGPSPAPDRLGAPLPPLLDDDASPFLPKVVVHSVEEVQEKLKTAESLKCTTSHALNARSSCSHCLLTFTITRCWKGSPLITVSVTLVDMAALPETAFPSIRMGNSTTGNITAPPGGVGMFNSGSGGGHPTSGPVPPVGPKEQQRQLAFQQFFTSLFYPLTDSEVMTASSTAAAAQHSSRHTNPGAGGKSRKEKQHVPPLASSVTSFNGNGSTLADPLGFGPSPSTPVPLLARYLAPLLRQEDMLVVVVLFVSLEVQHYAETKALLQLGQEIRRGSTFQLGLVPLSSNPPRVRWGDPGAVPVSRLTTDLETSLSALQREVDTVRQTLSVERLLRTTAPPLYLAGPGFEKLSSELVSPTLNVPTNAGGAGVDSVGASGNSGVLASATIAPILLTSVNKENLFHPAWSPSTFPELAAGSELPHATIISPTMASPGTMAAVSKSSPFSPITLHSDRLAVLEHREKLLTSAGHFIENELHRLQRVVSGTGVDGSGAGHHGSSAAPHGVKAGMKGSSGTSSATGPTVSPNQASPSTLMSAVLPDRGFVHSLLKELQSALASIPVNSVSGLTEMGGPTSGMVSGIDLGVEYARPASRPRGLASGGTAVGMTHLDQVTAYLVRCEALLESSLEENEILRHRMQSTRREVEKGAAEILQTKKSLVQANATMCQLLVYQSKLQQEKKRMEGYLQEMEMELYRECASQAVRQDTLLLFHRKESIHFEERRDLQKQVDVHRRNADSLQTRLTAMERERDQCLQAKTTIENEIKRREEAFKEVWRLLTPYQKARFNDYGSMHDTGDPNNNGGGGGSNDSALAILKRRRSQSATATGSPTASGVAGGSFPSSDAINNNNSISNNNNPPAAASNLLAQSHEVLVLRSQLKEAQRLLEDTRNSGKERDGVIEDLKAKGRRMSAMMDKKDAHYARLKQERDALREYAERMETQLVEAVVHSHRQVERLKMFREEIRVLLEEKRRLEASGEEYLSENSRLQKMVESLRKDMESQSSQIVGLQEHIQQINAERAQQNFHRQMYYESRIKELEKQLLQEKKNGKITKRSGARGSLEGPLLTRSNSGNGSGVGIALSLRMQNLRGKRRMRSAHPPPARSSTGSSAAAGSSVGGAGSGTTGAKAVSGVKTSGRQQRFSAKNRTRVIIASEGRSPPNSTIIHSGHGGLEGSIVSSHGTEYGGAVNAAPPPHSVRIARSGPVPQWE